MSAPQPIPTVSPDRTKLARIGLTLMGISFLLGAKPLGLLPVALGLFLPTFRILGWWLTVVLTVALLAITVGTAIFVAGTWSTAYAQAPGQMQFVVALIGLCVAGAAMALVGLLSPGTRRAVERRTLAVAPHAFDREA